MKLKNLLIIASISMSLLQIFGVSNSKVDDSNNYDLQKEYTQTDDTYKEQYNIVENEKSKKLQNEIKTIKKEKGELSQKDFQNLLVKYDGAERTFTPKVSFRSAQNNSYTEKVVKEGLNIYGSSPQALISARDYLSSSDMGLLASGVIIGSIEGGPAGAIAGGAIGAKVLGSRVKEGYNDIKKWIDVGSSRGGVRMTASAEFPIDSLNSIKQTKIRKL
ncbi:hypothetical protein [Anaerococcus ihuae]|uniref:hypothetical protein n=1 Tax=Anaerococcus ihuae TaxID=2899519 RepID=UPI001F29DFC4|nr:hypothetical protein [Anaerococcus ihuae]